MATNNKPLICKVCGSNDIVEKRGQWFCQACETYFKKNELTAKDIKSIASQERAESYLRLSPPKFEEAEEQFELLCREYPKQSAPYWGLLRAKYEIKYEIDTDGKAIPTCYSSKYEDFRDDPIYDKCIKLAESDDLRKKYESEAKRIAITWEEWENKAKKIDYDVFLSFKATDDSGNDTYDKEYVHNLYDFLVEKGYKVFYAPISMRKFLGQPYYDAYIFNALEKSKVLIVYGSKAEYFTSTWVQNEWTRYLKLIHKKQKEPDSLLLAYKDINPSKDLPKRLSNRQGQDCDDPRAFERLEKKIDEIFGRTKTEKTKEVETKAKNPPKEVYKEPIRVMPQISEPPKVDPKYRKESIDKKTFNDNFYHPEKVNHEYQNKNKNEKSQKPRDWSFLKFIDYNSPKPEKKKKEHIHIDLVPPVRVLVFVLICAIPFFTIIVCAIKNALFPFDKTWLIILFASLGLDIILEVLYIKFLKVKNGKKKMNGFTYFLTVISVIELVTTISITFVSRGKYDGGEQGYFYKYKSDGTAQVFMVPTKNMVIPEKLKNGKVVSEFTINEGNPDSTIETIDLQIPLTELQEGAFKWLEKLSSIKLPTTLKAISPWCFSQDFGFTTFKLPENITKIGEFAFCTCSYLTNFFTDSNSQLKVIDDSAFSNCFRMKSVSLPNGLEKLGQTVFSDCSALESITIPTTLSSIGKWCFWNTGLTSIFIPSNVTSIGPEIFMGCNKLTTIYCQASSRPAGWDYSWNGKCSAQVVWGSSPR